MDGKTYMGVNSGARVDYTPQDFSDAASLRMRLLWKYPDIMKTENIGQIPNNALYHAEATVLLRAARENGGTLSGKSIEVTVDRRICDSCARILPLIGQELGNPEVTFIDAFGNVRTMRDGVWVKGR
jgi:hypothetical protein